MSTSGWKDGRRLLWLSLVVGLVLRVAILMATRDLPIRIGDEHDYVELATSLVEHHTFAFPPDRLTSLRPPLYPVLVAAIWSVTGVGNLQAVRAVQILIALATTALVYLLARRAFDPVVARFAAAITWLYPTLIFFNFTILTETLFTFLLVAFVLLTVVLVQRPVALTAIACGVALGLAALTRSVVWPLPIVLCPLLAAILPGPWSRRIAFPALLFAGYAAAVAPWAIRNTRLQGVVEIVDTMGGMNLRMGNYEYTPDDRMWDAVSLRGEKSWIRGFDVPGTPTEGQKDKWAQRKAFEYIRANPGVTLRRAVIKFSDFWGLEREFAAGVNDGLFHPPFVLAAVASVLVVVVYVAVTLAAAAGVWITPAPWRVQAVMLLPVVAIAGVHTIVFGHSRYHLPLMPVLGIYASALAAGWFNGDLSSRSKPLIGATAVTAIAVTIWIHQIAGRDFARITKLFR